jgi:peptide/nickel transport system permease protein
MAATGRIDSIDALGRFRRPWYRRLWDHLRKHPLGGCGALVVFAIVFMAIFADYVAPYEPEPVNFQDMLLPPGGKYIFGTDQFGRDLLSRCIHGARTALFIGVIAAFTGATTGMLIGVASAYFGGKVDLILQRIIDVFLAFPVIIIALTVVAVFGTEIRHVIIAICLPFIPDAVRIVRANALAIRAVPYVDAARALGFSHWRIILRHMVPNVLAPYLIVLTANIGQAILLEASLSYLGMGVQEPTAAWGLMVQGGAEEYVESAFWVAFFPGAAITVAVFGFNLFGDSIRDALDPRLRSE